MRDRGMAARGIVATAACVLLGSCSGVGPFDATQEGAVPDRISLSPADFVLGAIGGQRQLAVTDDDGEPLAPGNVLSWRSSDPDVATVDGAGTVTAIGDGTATITAEMESTTASARVTVAAGLQVTFEVTALDQNDPDPSDNRVVSTITVQAR
ncbi:MAG: Ig-like domain-containing protein [Gemmatimonadota bacterium]